ncbi:MAG: 3'-5' exonuclease domain-containing protein 2 [Muribaculaceae bacterium]|nr:3'-5' exonuclease domain-containing protein 2 [Muribaculaceae bacterium]
MSIENVNDISNNNIDSNLIKISKEDVALLEKDFFEGRIIVIQSIEEAKKAVAYLSEFKVVGIDTESKPSFKKGRQNKIALLQISTDECCFLFRLNIMGFSPELAAFLENQNITKVGLSLKDDFMMLRGISAFTPKGFVDIQSIIDNYGIGEKSLQKIYAILFGKKISKSQRLSNWEADVLTDAQKRYASTDAWATLKIYEKLLSL